MTPDEMHADNVRRHGPARAEQARLHALALLTAHTCDEAGRWRERALLKLLDAVAEVHRACDAELGWAKEWDKILRALDAADRARSRASKLHTRIAFGAPVVLVPTDLAPPLPRHTCSIFDEEVEGPPAPCFACEGIEW